MSDPAQVTEPVSWWQAALGGGGVTTLIIGMFSLLTKRTEATAQVDTAHVEARVEMEREDTQQRKIEADAHAASELRTIDLLHDERVDHRSCRELVESQNAKITALSVAVATCESKHVNAEDKAAWYENRLGELEARLGIQARPAPKPRPTTPPNGTDVVTFAPVPTAPRKDPRREP